MFDVDCDVEASSVERAAPLSARRMLTHRVCQQPKNEDNHNNHGLPQYQFKHVSIVDVIGHRKSGHSRWLCEKHRPALVHTKPRDIARNSRSACRKQRIYTQPPPECAMTWVKFDTSL